MYADNAVEIARKAIPYMSEHGIPITPRNYYIWYEYFRGVIPDLRETVDELMKKSGGFDQRTADAVFNRFFIRSFDAESERKVMEEIKAVDEAGAQVSRILRPAAEDLMDMSESNASYGDRLDSLARKMSAAEVDQLDELFLTLAEDTRIIADRNHKISEQLTSSSRRLDELRNKLSMARVEARTDDLTKIANRRAFNERLTEEVEKVQNGNVTSCLALIDIDLFKRINDQYGHPVGDKALWTIANQLSESVGPKDEVFRYGGEEFAVILSNTGLDDAMSRIDHARQYICDQEFVIRDKTEEITISAGVALMTPERDTEFMKEITDEALYLAKDSGRNNVKSEMDLEKARDAKGASGS